MSTIIPSTGAGMASYDTDAFKTVTLVTGDAEIITTDEVVADAVVASADLAENTVVGFDGTGKVVKAVYGTTNAVGITCSTVLAGSTAKNVSIRRTGMFNPDALVWDASYDTDAKKKTAFDAAGKGIFMRKPSYQVF